MDGEHEKVMSELKKKRYIWVLGLSKQKKWWQKHVQLSGSKEKSEGQEEKQNKSRIVCREKALQWNVDQQIWLSSRKLRELKQNKKLLFSAIDKMKNTRIKIT